MKTFEEVKAFLATCKREAETSEAFGDSEVYWMKDGVMVATGYFSLDVSEVASYTSTSEQITEHWTFDGHEADRLRYIGEGG